MSKELILQKELNLTNEDIDNLSSFFDLLARFDYEDHKKEKSEVNSDILVSTPRVSELGSNFSK